MWHHVKELYPGSGDGRQAIGYAVLLVVGGFGLIGGLTNTTGLPDVWYWASMSYLFGLGSVGVLPTRLHRVRSTLMTVAIFAGFGLLAILTIGPLVR